jgi:predicted dehydrogenase
MLVIRFGLVGTNTSHSRVFASIFNGSVERAPAIAGGRVVAIWGDASSEARALQAQRRLPDAQALAHSHQIETVVADSKDMIGQIDAVLVIDDTGLGAAHGRLAQPFIAAGIPTFVDKPMTLDLHEAVALFDLAAQQDVPLMSSSALRYAREVAELQERAMKLGALSSVISVGPGDWYNYGVHAVEMFQTLVGPGARWVHCFPAAERDVVIVGYDEGPAVVVETLRDAAYLFHLVAYGANGWTECEVTDSDGFYTGLMAAVLQMVQTGHAPVSRAQTLEVLAVLHAALRSAATGRRVLLDEILPR